MTSEKYILLYKVISGSRAYGTHNKDSDYDYRGIAVPTKEFMFGLNTFDMIETKEPDETIYSLKKFANLALGANPNILELLFITGENLLHKNILFDRILENKEAFLSKKIFKTYLGYAESQKRKIINNPLHPEATNTKRREVIDRDGYDTKAAMHLMRLLHQLFELNECGSIQMPLKDSEFFRSIREGKFSLEEMSEMFESYFSFIRAVEEYSKLPEKPNFELINKLVIEIHEEVYLQTHSGVV